MKIKTKYKFEYIWLNKKNRNTNIFGSKRKKTNRNTNLFGSKIKRKQIRI